MKKNTIKSLVAYLNGANVPEIAEIKAELEAELAKGEAKAQANREAYSAAHDAVMSVLTDTPKTVAEIHAECADELPDGFSRSKVQYGLLNYWANEVVKVENPKGANTYCRKA